MQKKVKFFQFYCNISRLFGISGSDSVCVPSEAFTLIKTLWQQSPLIKCASVNESPGPVTGEMTTVYSFLGCSDIPCFVFCLQSQSQSKYPSTPQHFFSDFPLEITVYLHWTTWQQTRNKTSQGKKMCNVHRASDFSL